jgi:predicted DNA-binding transcriptional regulator AlpA
MAEGKFPEAVKLGERAVAWTESSISKWIADRVKQSPQGSRNGAA